MLIGLVRTFRGHPSHVGRSRARELAMRYGRDLRIARMSAGLTQARMAALAGVSQQEVSRAEAGNVRVSLDVRSRLAAATGHELGWRLYPVSSVALRDSGQLGLATAIVESAHATWAPRLEVPVGAGDLRAADVLLAHPREVVLVEIERALVDFQAQLRAAQLKREALATHEGRPVRLILALPDSRSVREKLAPLLPGIVATLPVPSRRVWASLRSGEPIGGDGLCFVRVDRAGPRPTPRGSTSTAKGV